MVFIREIIYIKIKDRTYVVNLDEYESVGNHWIALYINVNNATYFYSNILWHEIYYDKYLQNTSKRLMMWRYFCIGFIGFMLRSKSLLGYTNLFSPDEYEKNENDKINTKTFSITKKL